MGKDIFLCPTKPAGVKNKESMRRSQGDEKERGKNMIFAAHLGGTKERRSRERKV